MLPTLNEEKGIGETIDSINKKFFKKQDWNLEIIVVDGNSTDKTQEIAEKKDAQVIIEERKGYGRAYKTGIEHASGDIIVTGDADATYPFDQIHHYIKILLDENFDFLTTNRFSDIRPGSMTVKHRFGNLVLAKTLQTLFLINVKDSQSGMWIFKKEALRHVQPIEDFHNGMPFSEEIKIEMFTNKKLKTKEIPSTLHPRKGQVKIESFQDGWKNLKYLFKKRVTK
ncbi:MAG: glycosyltransferase family 2 protein [Candidatus Thermoplasmatota archaeon]